MRLDPATPAGAALEALAAAGAPRARVGSTGLWCRRSDLERLVAWGLGELEAAAVAFDPPPSVPPPVPQRVGERLWRALPPAEREAVAALDALARDRGMRIHLVGGTVRDLLLGRPPLDIDLAVEGDAHALAREAAEREGGAFIPIAGFGTCRLRLPPVDLELATARTEEVPRPGALPRVRPATLDRDLLRRDFTVNAMGLAPRGRALADPGGGREDLAAGRLRVLRGIAVIEDPLRAWRMARYAVRLGLAPTAGARRLVEAARAHGLLATPGLDRFGPELDRALAEPRPRLVLEALGRLGLLAACLDADFRPAPVPLEVLGRREGRADPEELERRRLLLAAGLPEPVRHRTARLVRAGGRPLVRWLEGPARVRAAAAALAAAIRRSEAARALAALDPVERDVLEALHPAATPWTRWWRQEGAAVRCAVDGHLLQARGHRPGPAFGPALEAARAAAWDGEPPEVQLARAEAVLARR